MGISCMTAALRFDGDLNVDMNEFQTNLVPFPRLHFMTSSYAPLANTKKKDGTSSVWDMVQEGFDPKNFNVKYVDFDRNEDKYMAISMKCDMMYSQRAYVHWYVGEGMEEGEFSEAREDLGFLEKDYLDVVTEQASDEQDEEF